MSGLLRGLGSAVPSGVLDQESAASLLSELGPRSAAQRRSQQALFRRAGVERRYLAALEPTGQPPHLFYEPARSNEDRGPTTAARMRRFAELAPPLALAAAREALREAALEAGEITHLVLVTCTGFGAPGIDRALIEELGLAREVSRTQIGFMGCHGALNGLRTADAFLSTDTQARVLLCAVELCSLHLQYGWDPERIVPNAIFGDGAAAAVLSPASEGARESAAGRDALRTLSFGSLMLPDCAEDMTWLVGDHGFEMTLSARVPEELGEELAPWLAAWLDAQGLGLAQVGSWAVHPGGPRILSSVERTLDLRPGALAVSREILARYGNMSSPTLLFILRELLRRESPRPYVALAFGPGLAIEAALLG